MFTVTIALFICSNQREIEGARERKSVREKYTLSVLYIVYCAQVIQQYPSNRLHSCRLLQLEIFCWIQFCVCERKRLNPMSYENRQEHCCIKCRLPEKAVYQDPDPLLRAQEIYTFPDVFKITTNVRKMKNAVKSCFD